jgi:hypothetical protein
MWPFKKSGNPDPVEQEAERRVSAVEDPPPTLEGWADGHEREDTQVIQLGLDAMKTSTHEGTASVTRTSRMLRDVAMRLPKLTGPQLAEE